MLRKNLNLETTIFALASGALPSAVAIEKISGSAAFEIAAQLFFPHQGEKVRRERAFRFGELRDLSGQKIDDCLMLSFVGPHSHSGEDSIEFHCHGSESIVRKLEDVLLSLGAVPAGRGEFVYRAYLNGKVTASEMDSLGDVYLAREPADLEKIYSRKDGSLQKKVAELRENLIRTQAILDTAVDFSEEYSSVVSQAKPPLIQTIHECSEIIQRYSVFRGGSSVPRLVIAGRPNAGKSSLFNALLGRYRAIVHEEAGTTRDVIEEDIEVVGRRWKLVDTAGFRQSEEIREKEGIELGENFLSSASFWILVVDGSLGLSPEEEELIRKYGDKPHLIVWNKQDLKEWHVPGHQTAKGSLIASLSAKTGEGIMGLWNLLEGELARRDASGPLPTSVQSRRLEGALGSMKHLLAKLEANELPEYLAELNREASTSLDSVVGQIGVEDVLDRVFGEFCIGK